MNTDTPLELTPSSAFLPLLAFAITVLVIGPLVLGLLFRPGHRRPGLPRLGRKIPAPRGCHADTMPIPITPVTAIEGIPLRMLAVPRPPTHSDFDLLIGNVHLHPGRYVQTVGRGYRR